jgi:hypothetical protein
MSSEKFRFGIGAAVLLLAATALSTLCLAGGVWLRHNQRHFVHIKSTEVAAMLGNAAGFLGSTFSGLSLLAVVYSLWRQENQRRDDVLRQSLLDILKTLHDAMPEKLLDYTPEPVSDTLSAAQFKATVLTMENTGISVDGPGFWEGLADFVEDKWGPQRFGKQRAMLIAVNELSGKASLDEQRLLHSISPAYLPVRYITMIVCDAFVGKDLAAIRAIHALGFLEKSLEGYGELASAVKRFSQVR